MTAPAGQALQGLAPLPADPPIGGLLWQLVVPALLFILAAGATYWLYRHFSRTGA